MSRVASRKRCQPYTLISEKYQTAIYNNSMNMFRVDFLISTAIKILIGWILIEKVPYWLKLNGIIATIVKVIGVLIIISALLSWV